MGDKDGRAPHHAVSAGVPVVPGCDVVRDRRRKPDSEAEQIGYPAADQGARGRRRARHPPRGSARGGRARVPGRVQPKRQAAFGDGACYMEKFLVPVKHIEMQLLCDHFGNVVCLGERECSMQRKNQKTAGGKPQPFGG